MANTTSRKDNKGRKLKDGESQRTDGRYMYRYTNKKTGKRISIYARDLAELREKEKALTLDLYNNVQTETNVKNLTLNNLFERHLNTLDVSQSTVVNYRSAWNNLIKDTIGEYKVVQILPSDIKSFYAELARKDYAYSTIKRCHNLLHPVLELAVNDDIILKNPTKGMLNAKYGRAEKGKQALTIEQQKNLLAFVQTNSLYNGYYPMLVIMLGTGVRCGELVGLTWQDVDMEAGYISINHQLIYKDFGDGCKLHSSTPKTSAGIRTIPMSESVKKAFQNQKALNDLMGKNGSIKIDNYTDFIFMTKRSNPILSVSVNKILANIVKAYNTAEQEKADTEHRKADFMPAISAHTMRHTFCTRMAENGMDIKVLQYIMGHANVNITMQVYTHIAEKKRIEDEIARFDFFAVS